MVDKKRKTKAAIMNELESIRGLLGEKEDSAGEIPVLHDTIDGDESGEAYRPDGQDLQALRDAAQALEDDAPRSGKRKPEPEPEPERTESQPSLFDAPRGQGENPFLPQHIRERLSANRARNAPKQNTKQSDDSERPPPARSEKPASPREQLIEETVASVLPQVAEELKQRLARLSDKQLRQLAREDDSET